MRKKGMRWTRWLTWLLLGIALISGAMIVSYFYTMSQDAGEFEELYRTIDGTSGEGAQSEADDETMFAGLRQLQMENQDLEGWITIPGTRINYPVMYTPEDTEYYLNRDFKKEKSRSGVPFLEGSCSPGISDNLIIYGHHMKNGAMFSDLTRYSEQSFWEANPTFTYYTPEGKQEYEIIAAFPVDVSKEETPECYAFIDASSREEFDRYLETIKKSALYETGVQASYGDGLMTLSTCSYHVEDGRFVVIGKA